MMGLMVNLYQSSSAYVDLPQTIIPSYESNDPSWFSPWDALRTGLADEKGRGELTALRDMMIAYWNGQQLPFDMAAKAFNVSVKARLDTKGVELKNKIPLEIFYNKANLLFLAKTIYLLVIFLFLYSLAVSNNFLRALLWIFSSSGIAAHALAVIIRITLLGRPPVSNLYETFVFVGFIGAVAGLLIERFNRQGLGFLVSGISGFVFLTIAGKFAADGDTLQMLVAVLNSNFWLSTHVLSITTGYAGVCVAGIVGHVYLLQAAFRPQQKEVLKKTYSVLLGTLAFGLIMTFLGTNLGGIWADQSWGRFWGWDPKENGAMLIVLWTAILFHAKIAKMVNELGMAVGSVLGIIVVMWAWFGVNLLSIGLHSYGFTSGLARNLTIYFVLQLAFIAVIAPLAYKRSKNN
jgi:ABC-type transport system involved in cytochrome c biogenesis permease subunit